MATNKSIWRDPEYSANAQAWLNGQGWAPDDALHAAKEGLFPADKDAIDNESAAYGALTVEEVECHLSWLDYVDTATVFFDEASSIHAMGWYLESSRGMASINGITEDEVEKRLVKILGLPDPRMAPPIPKERALERQIMMACVVNHVELVRDLLNVDRGEFELDLNAIRSERHGSLLAISARSSFSETQLEMMELLVANGADVNDVEAQADGRPTALIAACDAQSPQAVAFLMANGVTEEAIAYRYRGESALSKAIEARCSRSVEHLLAGGADPNNCRGDGLAALELLNEVATYADSPEIDRIRVAIDKHSLMDLEPKAKRSPTRGGGMAL